MTTETAAKLPPELAKKGQVVGIPCDVYDVPFPNEKLVAIDTLDGKMEAFVNPLELRQMGDQWQIRAFVQRQEEDRLVVWSRGEFTRTNGILYLPLGFAVPA